VLQRVDQRRDDGTDRIVVLAWNRYACSIGKMYLDIALTGDLDRHEFQPRLCPTMPSPMNEPTASSRRDRSIARLVGCGFDRS
jgi:hypothetical protein